MKIPDIYKGLNFDDKTTAVDVDKELRYLWEQVIKLDSQILELLKKEHYQKELFNRVCKDKLPGFNNLCCTTVLFKAFYDGMFKKENRKKSDSIQMIIQLVCNYFPEWMWDDVEFVNAIECNYGETVEFKFEWKYSTGKTQDIAIDVPNPDNIQTGKTFLTKNALEINRIVTRALEFNNDFHMTNVFVTTKKLEHYSESDLIGSAYMNSDIKEIIDKWAKDLL